jgi:glucosamine--fructose-6-phosphate aminotransferase (isomerizing)
MCGIIGYKGQEGATTRIHEGLKKLEYRGYDSAGIAVSSNPSIKMEKGTGDVDQLQPDFKGDAGIGHTRWATHGGVTDENAHPHTSHSGKIAVVHNGIIENHRELKEEIGEHKFQSETDTEVIPHLLEKHLERHDMKTAVEKTIEKLEGSYAVTAVLETGEMIAFRQDSPLVIGLKEKEYFIASDVNPFIEHTKDALFLQNGDYAIIEEELKVFNSGEKVDREVKEIEWDAEEASKEGYDHFMEKEIHEQPETVKRAVFQDKSDVEKSVEMIEDADRVFLTACGTASFAAMLGAKYLREKGFEAYSEQAHEFEYMASDVKEDDLVIAVSQSGETADLLSALDEVDAPVLSVTNVVGSTLARNSDHNMYINAGPEIGVASTKAFTAQMTVLKLVSYSLDEGLEYARNSLLETAGKIEEMLEDNRETIYELSEFISEKDDVYFIGRNKGRELAMEASLKLKELSYIHSEAFPGGEFKHGTLSLIEEGVPVVAFTLDDKTNTLSNAIEASSRGAELIGVDTEEHEAFDHLIRTPEDENREILEVIPFQLLAYETSLLRENDPDKPRNLAKSVTVK